MQFDLDIKSFDAAATDDPTGEVCRVMRDIAVRLLAGATSGLVRDINGNTIGRWTLWFEEEGA